MAAFDAGGRKSSLLDTGYRSRPPAELAQSLAFDPLTPEFVRPAASSSLAATAEEPADGGGARGGAASSSQQALDAVKGALLWENPPLSAALCLAGAAVALLGDLLPRSCSLVSLAAYLMLAEVALNFGRSVFSSAWLEEAAWQRSYAVKALAASTHAGVLRVAALHDAFIAAEDPALTLKVAGLLWACVHLGNLLSTWHFACLAYFLSFGLGAAHRFAREPIHQAYSGAVDTAKERWAALGAPRGAAPGGALACLALVAWLAHWRDRLLIVFLMAVVVRCNMKPSEVDAFASAANTTCGPYLRSAKKQAHRLGRAATEMLASYSPGRTGLAQRKPHPQ